MLIDCCRDNSIEPCIYKTGASYTNKEMKEGNYTLGGEYSGHIFFRDKWVGFDDGIYAGLRLIEMLSNSDATLSELVKTFNKYENEYVEYPIDIDKKDEIVNKVKDYVISKGYKYLDIDGVRVEFPDGWALVRYSNTGPNITARFEASTEERLQEIQDEFIGVINENN